FAMLWKVYDWPSPHDFARATFGHTFADVRESWVVEQDRLAAAAQAAAESAEPEAESHSDVPPAESPAAEPAASEPAAVEAASEVSSAEGVPVSAIAEEVN